MSNQRITVKVRSAPVKVNVVGGVGAPGQDASARFAFKTASFTAEIEKSYLVHGNAAPFFKIYIIDPADPSEGDYYSFVVASGSAELVTGGATFSPYCDEIVRVYITGEWITLLPS